MSIPKRHHFVPRMLLRRFTDENGRLHFFDKRIAEKGVLSASPANLFVERHLYTQHGEDGDKDVSVETMLAGLEGPADKIIEKIISAARTGQLPNLTPSEKSSWDQYFYYQWKRVPDVHDGIVSSAEFEEWIRQFVEEFEETIRPLTADEHSKMKDPKVLAGIRQNARVQAVAKPGDEMVRILGDKGLLVAIIPNPKKSFVIGSHPVVKLTYPGRSNLADPSVEVWLPLAHDVAVTPGFSRVTEKLVELNEDRHIRMINEATLKQSTAIAGRSRTLVASLAGV